MAESEVAALKEALYDQYNIMKKLYKELEEEREASATAASETLSMILRIQREKAAEKMEACQYKRMAEERIQHAEECMAFLEGIIQQDEIEIASLRYQLEVYKQSLAKSSYPLSPLGSQSYKAKLLLHGLVKRNISSPSLARIDDLYSDMNTLDQDQPLFLGNQPIWENGNKSSDEGEEVNKLKEYMQVKNANGAMCSDQETGSCSWFSASSISSRISRNASQDNLSLDYEANNKTIQTVSAHDIFEVLQKNKDKCLDEPVYEPKKISSARVYEREFSPRNKPSKREPFCYNWTLDDPKSEFDASTENLEQLKVRLKQMENERNLMHEDTERSKEQLMLLRSIFKQLNTIELKMKRSESTKRSVKDDPKVVSLMEAVLSFSI